MADYDNPIVKGTQNAAMPLAPPPAMEGHTQLSGTDKLTTLEIRSDNRPFTQRQRRVEEEMKLVGAMESGLTPVYDNPERPSKRSVATVEPPVDDQGDFKPCTLFLYGRDVDGS